MQRDDIVNEPPAGIRVRHQLQPGDLGLLISQHAAIYFRECGYDSTFEAYVAESLAKFALSQSDSQRLWIAERNGRFAGCIGMVRSSEREAQLRWFLVDPSARGSGLGAWLLRESLDFARACGYETVLLWTEKSLTVAARMYQTAGFRKVEEHNGAWGVDVVEEKYVMSLND